MQTKTDTDGERTGDDRQIREIDAQSRDPERRGQNHTDIAETGGHRMLDTGLQLRLRQNPVRQDTLYNAGHQQQADENRQRNDNVQQRYPDAA